jgi:hypothetical protein
MHEFDAVFERYGGERSKEQSRGSPIIGGCVEEDEKASK